MGYLSPVLAEKERHQVLVNEGFFLHGVPCKLYQVANITRDINRDPSDIVYSIPVDIDVMPEEFPRKTLKNLGWITEDDENLPFIVHFPVKDRNNNNIVLARYCKVVFPTVLALYEDRNFIITRVKSDGIDVIYWTCKLVPERKLVDVEPLVDGVQVKRVGESKVTDTFINRGN